MSLSERSRSALYVGLVEVVHDAEAVEEMLSNFPAREVDEPVTKDFLRAELTVQGAEMQAEFAAVRTDFQAEFAAVRTEFQADSAAMRDEFRTEFASVRTEMQTEFAAVRRDSATRFAAVHEEFIAVRSEMQAGSDLLRIQMYKGFQRQTVFLVSAIVGINGLFGALLLQIR